MPIPDFQTIMLPLLRLASDGREHHIRDTILALAQEFRLSDDERQETYPHSGSNRFNGRVRWAHVYLTQAGLLERVGRGRFRISRRGKDTLLSNPTSINVRYLEQFDLFKEFKKRTRIKKGVGEEEKLDEQPSPDEGQPPQDVIEAAYQLWKTALAQLLLERVQKATPKFFEKLVIDLLLAMGYGRSVQDAGRVIGRSGDEGVDGVINEDELGLDVVYIQAKRWQGSVSRKEVQAFSGALDGQRANKGVMITTSKFTDEAQAFAKKSSRRIVLVDGNVLTDLMIKHGVGVSDKDKPTYILKDIDTDYFEEP